MSNYIDDFNNRKQNLVELRSRINTGLLQLKYHPLKFLYLLLCFLLFAVAWGNRTRLIPPFFPQILLPALDLFIEILLAVTLATFLTAILKLLGIQASRKIEGQLVAAFSAKDLKENGYPLLASFKPGKEANSKVMVFYSHIALTRWKEMKERIEEETGMHMESVDYRNGKPGNYKEIIFLYGKKQSGMQLRDAELEKELENVD